MNVTQNRTPFPGLTVRRPTGRKDEDRRVRSRSANWKPVSFVRELPPQRGSRPQTHRERSGPRRWISPEVKRPLKVGQRSGEFPGETAFWQSASDLQQRSPSGPRPHPTNDSAGERHAVPDLHSLAGCHSSLSSEFLLLLSLSSQRPRRTLRFKNPPFDAYYAFPFLSCGRSSRS